MSVSVSVCAFTFIESGGGRRGGWEIKKMKGVRVYDRVYMVC